MPGEIVNTLGFDVGDALDALAKLDNLLRQNQTSFENLAGSLSAWNTQASTTIDRLRQIVAAAREAVGSLKGVQVPTAAASTAAPTSPGSLWLPAGVRDEPGAAPSAAAAAAGATATAAADAVDKLNKSQREAAKLYEATRTPAERYNAQLAKLKDLADKGAISTDTHSRAVKLAGQEMTNATKKTNAWTVSWETLARVVATQMIVRAMSMIRDALKESVSASIEFQQQIAEIRTIAPALGGTFQQLTSEVAEFAKQYNVPLTQAASGLYETISDQFETMGERANIMTAAVKLSRTTLMDFKDAVLLISGTLNAYGMASSEADSVASKFFTTIKLGRVHGQELAQSIGTIIPIASELGIRLDEVNASVIAMTIGGMDMAKATTALRGTMMALLKPSDDMKKVIRELGFSSPEQLIAAKEYQGALTAIADASSNMSSEIVKSVRNQRALTGWLRLTQEGAEKVEQAIVAMGTSTPEAMNKIWEQFASTDSEKLTKSINQLKVNLTQDFGSMLTSLLAGLTSVGGGADQLAAAIQGIGVAAIPAGVALGTLAAAAMVAQLSLGPVGLAIMGAAAAITLFAGGTTYMTARSINETRRMATEHHMATVQYLKDEEEKLRKAREVQDKIIADDIKSYENRASVIRKDYFAALDDLKVKNKETIESDRQVMHSMISSQDRIVAAYRNAANASLRIVQEAQRNRASLEGQAADQRFKERRDEELDLNTKEKASMTLRAGWALQEKANQATSSAKTEDDLRIAHAIQQRAKAYIEEGSALAKESGDAWLILQAHNSIRSALDDEIKAQDQLMKLQAARAESMASIASKEQQKSDQMKALTKQILVDLQAFDKNGAKTPKELAEQGDRLTKNIAKFRELFMDGKNLDIGDLLNMDALQRRMQVAIEGGASEVEINQLYGAPETFTKFREDIEKGMGPVKVWIERGRMASGSIWKETAGMTAEETQQVFTQRLTQSRTILNKFSETKDALDVANKSLDKSHGEITSALDRWANVGWLKDLERFGGLSAVIANANSLMPGKFAPIREALNELQPAIDKFNSPDAKPTTKDLETLKAAYEKYLTAVKPGANSREGFAKFLQAAEGAAAAGELVGTYQAGLKELGPGANEAQRVIPILMDALRAAEAIRQSNLDKNVQKPLDNADTSATSFKTSMSQVPDMGALATNLLTSAGAMDRMVVAAGSIGGFGQSLNAATGGKVWDFLASGGRARGTDTEPAMLSPREIVMNERAAQRFSSQLMAMNAGVQPSFHSQGGSVTNVGDINVTVSGGGSSRQTARSIATELRRELRRGTSTL